MRRPILSESDKSHQIEIQPKEQVKIALVYATVGSLIAAVIWADRAGKTTMEAQAAMDLTLAGSSGQIPTPRNVDEIRDLAQVLLAKCGVDIKKGAAVAKLFEENRRNCEMNDANGENYGYEVGCTTENRTFEIRTTEIAFRIEQVLKVNGGNQTVTFRADIPHTASNNCTIAGSDGQNTKKKVEALTFLDEILAEKKA